MTATSCLVPRTSTQLAVEHRLVECGVVVKQKPRRFAGWPAHICPTQPCRPACRETRSSATHGLHENACRGLGELGALAALTNSHNVRRFGDKCSLGGQLSVCYYDSAGQQSRAQGLHNRLQVRCVCSITGADTARRISRRGEFGERQGTFLLGSTTPGALTS
jgi:hypothetical protein